MKKAKLGKHRAQIQESVYKGASERIVDLKQLQFISVCSQLINDQFMHENVRHLETIRANRY
jgi:hypothetical protein